MFQIYFLSVITNILSGMALASKFLTERFEGLSGYTGFMSNRSYRVWLGGITAVTGLITLFKTSPVDKVIIGDLLPALSGLVAGFLLVMEFFAQKSSSENAAVGGFASHVGDLSGPYSTAIGITAVILGILHAVAPTALLL